MSTPRISERPSEGVKSFLLTDLILTATSMPFRIALAVGFLEEGGGAQYALGTRSLVWDPVVLIATSLIVYLAFTRGSVSVPLNWLAGIASFVSIYNRFEMASLIGGRPIGDLAGPLWCTVRLFWLAAWIIVMVVETRRYRYVTSQPDESLR